MSHTERADCRLCGGGLRAVLNLGRTPLANALVSSDQVAAYEAAGSMRVGGEQVRELHQEFTAPLYLSRCETCGHVQLPVVVDPKLLFTDDYPYLSSTSPVFRKHLEDLAEECTSADDDLFIAEIGSNDGYLLSQLWKRGARCIGIDPAVNLAHDATERGQLTVPAFFDGRVADAVKHACGPADIVVALNVFAHADDLASIANGVRALLRLDGLFIFEVAYLPRMLERGYFDCIYHEHLAFHHLTPLVSFLEKHGLLLVDAVEVDSQGGSIRCYARRASGYEHIQSERLLAMLKAEKETCSAEAVAAFANRVELGKRMTRELSAKWKAQGKRIAAFGCPAKATTMLHYYGLGRETFEYLVEENKAKQGKFSPGKHIPIVAPEHFDSHPVDIVVCLAWNFAEDIKKRYAHWPVEWVVPFEEKA